MMKTRIAEIIRRHRRFDIISHEGPDADAVGSSRGLAFGLLALGKQVRLLYPTQVPASLELTAAPRGDMPGEAEVTLLVDVSGRSLLGDLVPKGTTVVIDHHKSNAGVGDVWWVEPGMSSASEMVYELLSELGAPVDATIATNLYMGIFGDTGGFMHANTTPRVFAIAHELCRAGADPHFIAYRMKKCRSLGYFQLLSLVMERLTIQDRVYGSYLTEHDMIRLGARAEDTAGLVEEMASVAHAELSILLKELDAETVHCSMRSKDTRGALLTAQAFGGGGHDRAAGFVSQGRVRDLMIEVIEEGVKWAHTA